MKASVKKKGLIAFLAVVLAASGSGGGVSLRIPSESAPPGGSVQIKVELTEPTPISTSKTSMPMDGNVFDEDLGIALHSPAGDASGIAVRGPAGITIHCTAPSGTFGTNPDYPIITATVAVKQSAPLGLVSPLTIDASTSFWQDLFGRNYPAEFKPGTITISAGLSVRNLVPGGGNVAAGTSIRMTGTGFVPATTVKIEDVDLAAVRYVSPTELELIAKADANLQSKRVRVTNPDRTQVVYYSYLRGVETSPSGFRALANVKPIFPDKTVSGAIFAAPAQLPWSQGQFTAIAIQNPNSSPAAVTVTVYSLGGGGAVSSATLAVPSGARVTRELTELLGDLRGRPPRFLVIQSPQPVQMIGIVGETAAGTVLPMAPLVSR